MDRRGFLSSCLALAAAPAIVRADSLMRVVPREMEFFTLSQPGVVSVWHDISGNGNHLYADTEVVIFSEALSSDEIDKVARSLLASNMDEIAKLSPCAWYRADGP